MIALFTGKPHDTISMFFSESNALELDPAKDVSQYLNDGTERDGKPGR